MFATEVFVSLISCQSVAHQLGMQWFLNDIRTYGIATIDRAPLSSEQVAFEVVAGESVTSSDYDAQSCHHSAERLCREISRPYPAPSRAMSLKRAMPSNLFREADIGVEQFLAALARASSDAVIGKTVDGRVIFWNEAAERLYGYSADEMLGVDFAVVFPTDRPKELSELLTRVRAGETVRDFRTERIRKDGLTVSISITMSPVLNEAGSVLGISTIARDLTLFNLQIADLRDAHRKANETLSLSPSDRRSWAWLSPSPGSELESIAGVTSLSLTPQDRLLTLSTRSNGVPRTTLDSPAVVDWR